MTGPICRFASRHAGGVEMHRQDKLGRASSQPDLDAAEVPPISPIAFGDEMLLGSVMDLADWAASHARSAAECAWRGDVQPLGAHLEQARNAIEAARMTYAALATKAEAVP